MGIGIGKTVKEKVCVHTSRDIRAIASQLVSVWLEVFRKEKASNGGLKFSRQATAVDFSKRKKDPAAGKPPLHANHGTYENRGSIQVSATTSKPETNSLKSQGSTSSLHVEVEDAAPMTEEEKAAFDAAEAARTAALAAVEVCLFFLVLFLFFLLFFISALRGLLSLVVFLLYSIWMLILSSMFESI